VDMGIEPYLISSSLVGVFAQRLVRTICPVCKEGYEPLDKELQSVGLKRENLINGHLFRGKGCSSCYDTGYKGRRGIYELMTLTNTLKKQIVKSPDAVELRRLAIEEGMMTLIDHGAELARQGVTTITEILRATRGVEEEL
jgi:general secretion pathway protein E